MLKLSQHQYCFHTHLLFFSIINQMNDLLCTRRGFCFMSLHVCMSSYLGVFFLSPTAFKWFWGTILYLFSSEFVLASLGKAYQRPWVSPWSPLKTKCNLFPLVILAATWSTWPGKGFTGTIYGYFWVAWISLWTPLPTFRQENQLDPYLFAEWGWHCCHSPDDDGSWIYTVHRCFSLMASLGRVVSLGTVCIYH